MKEMSLGMFTVLLFAKALEECLKVERKDFYDTSREGDRGFISQRCSNAHGRYMALVEYGGGDKQNFIFIPEERGSKGWRKLADALREAGREGGHVGCNRGGAF